VAGTALPGRLTGRLVWRVARLVEAWDETPTARTLVLSVPGWPGHLAGQHVDVRLTAEDGYSAQRSYTVAGPTDGERVTLTVQRLADGEVSPFLAGPYAIGDPVEVRGPVGGWFVWRPTDPEPVFLVAGGSGIVPLMGMIRARAAARSAAPFRLLYSLRTPVDRFYATDLDALGDSVGVRYAYTREVPPGWSGPPGRVTKATLVEAGFSPLREPTCLVCGPTGFVETVANQLVDLGHDPSRIKTERFGG
jgi:ferredoxin-NADP reductase